MLSYSATEKRIQTSSFSENTLSAGRQLVGLCLEEAMRYAFQTFREHRVSIDRICAERIQSIGLEKFSGIVGFDCQDTTSVSASSE